MFFDQKSLQMVRFPIGFHKDGILFLHTDFKLFETDAVKVILYLDMLKKRKLDNPYCIE